MNPVSQVTLISVTDTAQTLQFLMAAAGVNISNSCHNIRIELRDNVQSTDVVKICEYGTVTNNLYSRALCRNGSRPEFHFMMEGGDKDQFDNWTLISNNGNGVDVLVSQYS